MSFSRVINSLLTFGVSSANLLERPMRMQCEGRRRGRSLGKRFDYTIEADATRQSVMERYWDHTQAVVGGKLAATQCVWAVSDLHMELPQNMEWLKSLPRCGMDTLIVAGNVATSMRVLEVALSLLVERFQHVFYVPGNIELWLDGSSSCEDSEHSRDSGSKFLEILSLCDRLRVHTTPQFVGNLLICPLFSWYKVGDEGLGFGQPLPDDSELQAVDAKCSWPAYLSPKQHAIADFFADLNRASDTVSERHSDEISVISFSHFVPYKELFPGPAAMRHVMGCERIARQVASCGSIVHVFGHSRIRVDRFIHNTRYIQAALGMLDDSLSASPSSDPESQSAFATVPALVRDCLATRMQEA
eukprot:TRINITY_DN49622_c0_g1_i1.p1 TRINITY_DN49622_c0_g1~~TRINITY_DN49622_c0_g1_i1.p1  ORF type:complete len:359 (+),score=47.24 TRINITY_DN49622_c0_g1_i1:402-1478(+)